MSELVRLEVEGGIAWVRACEIHMVWPKKLQPEKCEVFFYNCPPCEVLQSVDKVAAGWLAAEMTEAEFLEYDEEGEE